ncbi:hypothetical protein ACM66Z_00215 [Sulfurovum sp. ST-21]|uniref:Polysaccharide chain length determinant N-terminal domain-containing protein n=1 Tax=Sulfurovum indicum TaxID=2779528 RepID=A0A7M1S3E5_9BACT|nr:hypothetical protein [Sulfurovum indicum]QOR61953.1 hypothetical protein IMZ28_00215 [Sulfurovum indicum]
METETPKRIKENFFLIEPLRIVAALREKLLYILVTVILFAALGAYIAIKKESKSWSATSKIIRYSKQISQSSDVPYQFQNFNYETALETIRTRSNLIELIRRLDLNGTTPEELYSQFEIKRGRNSDIIEIIFTSPDQKLAAKGANTLSQIFIDNFYRVQNAAIERIYEYYNQNKIKKEQEFYKTKEAMNAFLKEHNLTSLESEISINYTLLNKLEQKKLQIQTDITAYKTSIKAIEDSLHGIPEEVKLRYAIRSANKKTLELKEKELQRLKEVYTDEHPKVQMLESELRQIRKTIKENKTAEPDEVTYGTNPIKSELRVVLGKTKIEYTTALNIQKALKGQIEGVKQKLEYLTTLNKEFLKLKRAKDEAHSQLDLISKRLYDLKISIGSSKEDFKLFEPAKVPKFPKPSYKKVIVILFAFLGGFLSVLIITVRELLHNGIKTKFDLETRFGITDVVQLPKEKLLSSESRQVFSFLANNIINKDTDRPHIITVGADTTPKHPGHITDMLMEHLIYQKHKVLHISASYVPCTKNGINEIDLISPLEPQTFKPHKEKTNVYALCWYLKDNYSIFIPNKEHIEKVFKALREFDYDYIIIDLPSYYDAKHLVPMFVEQADTFLLCTEFKTSKRKVIHEFLLQLKEESLDKIKGVISETRKYYIY